LFLNFYGGSSSLGLLTYFTPNMLCPYIGKKKWMNHQFALLCNLEALFVRLLDLPPDKKQHCLMENISTLEII